MPRMDAEELLRRYADGERDFTRYRSKYWFAISSDQLANTDLRGINLSGFDLAEMCLDGANLSGANLSGTTFAQSSLDEANLRGANLSGAKLIRTRLYCADLTDAAWVSLERWEALSSEEQERFPPICPDFVIELR